MQQALTRRASLKTNSRQEALSLGDPALCRGGSQEHALRPGDWEAAYFFFSPMDYTFADMYVKGVQGGE